MDVGLVLKPQGIRGEVKVKPLTDDPSRFNALKSVQIDGKPVRISAVRVSGGDVFIKFVGVDDRNAAETLRNKLLSIDRAAAKPLDDGEFFIADLIGTKLLSRRDGEISAVGDIVSVDSYGAADVVTVKTERGDMSFAFVMALGPELDIRSRTLSVDGKTLDEVAVYEN